MSSTIICDVGSEHTKIGNLNQKLPEIFPSYIERKFFPAESTSPYEEKVLEKNFDLIEFSNEKFLY